MIPIVFSTDHNYIMPAGVTIASLLFNSEGTVYDIYLLISPDVTTEDKDLITRQVALLSPLSSVNFIEMGGKYQQGYEIRGISKACYYRLMIPWLIPNVDKIIYCDVDIIFKSSLVDLYAMDIENYYVAGAVPCEIYVWERMQKYFKRINIDYKEYINSGVLVINSRKQRELKLDKIYDELSKKKFLYQDQDIINIACKGKIAHFDQRYNLKPSLYATGPEFFDNVVLHYAGEKPWDAFTYAWAEWWEIYNKSIFRDDRLYHTISARILSLKYQFQNVKKKTKRKVQIMKAQYFGK